MKICWPRDQAGMTGIISSWSSLFIPVEMHNRFLCFCIKGCFSIRGWNVCILVYIYIYSDDSSKSTYILFCILLWSYFRLTNIMKVKMTSNVRINHIFKIIIFFFSVIFFLASILLISSMVCVNPIVQYVVVFYLKNLFLLCIFTALNCNSITRLFFLSS